MPYLDKLERNFGRFAIPRLPLYLVAAQVVVFVLTYFDRLNPAELLLMPLLVWQGQYWRLVSFLALPPNIGLLFIGFAWWMFYLMGSALEEYWGAFRFNLFLLAGYVFTVGLSFIRPADVVSNAFLAGSVFLAFAYLNPEFELAIFFILPVKIRWLALFAWAGYFVSFVAGSWSTRLQVFAAVGNFFLFFGRDLWSRAGQHRLQMTAAAKKFGGSAEVEEPRHRCRTCGKTSITHPREDFRYCSKCADDSCYCSEHIYNHEHVLKE
jgi:hypothetical protein